MRSQLTMLLSLALLATGCKKDSHDRRWILSESTTIARTFIELTNEFSNACEPYLARVDSNVVAGHVLLLRFPHSGIPMFEAYVYKNTDHNYWSLRSVSLLNDSASMTASLIITNGGVGIVHDGKIEAVLPLH
jgi:hypothetical protein